MASKKSSKAEVTMPEGGKPAYASKKTECPITRAEFLEHGPSQIDKVRAALLLLPYSAKVFSTGSYGVNGTGKLPVNINGKQVKCQVSINGTVVGSKTHTDDQKKTWADLAAKVVNAFEAELKKQTFVAKEFSTGSLGYNSSGKMHLSLEEEGEVLTYTLQLSANVTVIGSKDLPKSVAA